VANPAVVVDFVANTKDLSRNLKRVENRSSSLKSSLRSLGKTGALAAGAAGVGALVYTLKTGISEYAETQRVAAQTNAVIKSTGGVANVTAKEVSDLAESIMKKTGIDDEAIASGENLLLTFTNIRDEVGKGNDIFTQATGIMTDMSVALGQDMKQSAIQLGKALNDPVRGMSALRRVGVSFTEAQQEQVKAMVAAGDTMGAQKLILAELNKEFGGSAEAAGKTLPGQIAILRETFNNFAGDIVAKLIPVLQEAVAWFREHWPEISEVIKTAWERDIRPTVLAIGELIASVAKFIIDNWGTIGPIVKAVVSIIEAELKIAGSIIRLFAAILRGDWTAAWNALKGIVEGALGAVLAVLRLYAAVGGALYRAAGALGDAIERGVVAGLQGIGNAAWGVINNIWDAITNQTVAVVGWGKNVGAWIRGGVVEGITGIGNAAWGVVDNVWTVISGYAETITGWGKSIGGWIKSGVETGLKGIGQALAAMLKAGLNLVITAWNRLGIPGFKVNMPRPIPDVSIPGIPFPNIPHLAKGGIVTAPTLALIGESGPEAVVPLSGGAPSFDVRVFIGEQELRSMVRTEITDADNRTAQVLLSRRM
jgi:hypothetical protein